MIIFALKEHWTTLCTHQIYIFQYLKRTAYVRVLLTSSFFRALRFSPARLSLPHEVCDSPDQAAHYRTLGRKLRPPLTLPLAGLEVKVVFSVSRRPSTAALAVHWGTNTAFRRNHLNPRLVQPISQQNIRTTTLWKVGCKVIWSL
jgi:hypothetical protein